MIVENTSSVHCQPGFTGNLEKIGKLGITPQIEVWTGLLYMSKRIIKGFQHLHGFSCSFTNEVSKNRGAVEGLNMPSLVRGSHSSEYSGGGGGVMVAVIMVTVH